jgi:hypothetical protein
VLDEAELVIGYFKGAEREGRIRVLVEGAPPLREKVATVGVTVVQVCYQGSPGASDGRVEIAGHVQVLGIPKISYAGVETLVPAAHLFGLVR